MRNITCRTAGALLIALLVPVAALAQKRGFVATDYYKEIVPGDVALSPAGDLVAFTKHVMLLIRPVDLNLARRGIDEPQQRSTGV